MQTNLSVLWLSSISLWVLSSVTVGAAGRAAITDGVKVGAAAAELEADDSMVIAGGITPGKASGQEGKLRAVAVVLEKQPFGKFAIVACDVLMITRRHLDPVVTDITKATGIPP